MYLGASVSESTDEYLQGVIEELRRRERALSSLEKEISALRFELDRERAELHVLSGHAGAVAQREAFRRSLRERVKAKEQERTHLVEDIKRAQERKQLVEEELSRERSSK